MPMLVLVASGGGRRNAGAGVGVCAGWLVMLVLMLPPIASKRRQTMHSQLADGDIAKTLFVSLLCAELAEAKSRLLQPIALHMINHSVELLNKKYGPLCGGWARLDTCRKNCRIASCTNTALMMLH